MAAELATIFHKLHLDPRGAVHDMRVCHRSPDEQNERNLTSSVLLALIQFSLDQVCAELWGHPIACSLVLRFRLGVRGVQPFLYTLASLIEYI